MFLRAAMDYRGTAEKRQRSYRELTVVLAIAGTVPKLPFLSYYGLVSYTGNVALRTVFSHWAAERMC